MDKLVAAASFAKQAKKVKLDDDCFDRLSSRYTVSILVVFAVINSMTAYVGDPITCWSPVHFAGSHTKFSKSYCWVKNTYYIPWDNDVPRPQEDAKRQEIPYYQWVPFILLAQAVGFYFPSVLWHAFNSRAGVDSDSILQSAHTLRQSTKEEKREKTLKMICNQMHRFMKTRKKQTFQRDCKHILAYTICRPCSRRFGNYLVILYLLSKILYIANIMFQLFILNRVLAMEFNVFGAKILSYLTTDTDWTTTDFVAFPRVTFCDFSIRRLGNIHRYTLQCLLRINLFNEKMYVFLWFWFVFVAFFTILGFIQWLLRSLCTSDRIKFIRNHLMLGNKINLQSNEDLEASEDFVNNYLRQDGAFVLRLIAHNTDNITVTDIICKLFDMHQGAIEGNGNGSENGSSIEAKPLLPGPSKDSELKVIDEN